jgi:hypothetical protein
MSSRRSKPSSHAGPIMRAALIGPDPDSDSEQLSDAPRHPTCWGCLTNQGNQAAHWGVGGCYPDGSLDSDEEDHDDAAAAARSGVADEKAKRPDLDSDSDSEQLSDAPPNIIHPTCWGCLTNQGNQAAHWGVGGCYPDGSLDSDEEDHDDAAAAAARSGVADEKAKQSPLRRSYQLVPGETSEEYRERRKELDARNARVAPS